MNTATRALLLTIIGIGALLAVLYATSGGVDNLEPEARNFIEAYFEDEGITKAYSVTTAAFAVANDMRAFYDQRQYYMEVLGAYRGVVEVLSESVDPAGRGSLEMRVAFEKGEVPVVFAFRHEKERWLVDDFEIEIPRKLAPERDWVIPQNFARVQCSRWAQGDQGIEGVWQLFTAALRRQKDMSLFIERSEAELGTLGEYKSVENGTLDESNKDEPSLSYTIHWAEGSRKADVALVWQKGRWFISHFEIEGLSLD